MLWSTVRPSFVHVVCSLQSDLRLYKLWSTVRPSLVQVVCSLQSDLRLYRLWSTDRSSLVQVVVYSQTFACTGCGLQSDRQSFTRHFSCRFCSLESAWVWASSKDNAFGVERLGVTPSSHSAPPTHPPSSPDKRLNF